MWILVFIIVASFSCAYDLSNKKISQDQPNAKLTVEPHTTLSRSQWQNTYINSKAVAGDFCVAYVFSDELLDYEIQLYDNIIYNNTPGFDFIDKTKLFGYQEYLGNHIYYTSSPTYFREFDQNNWRIKYNPSTPSGKWDLIVWNPNTKDCFDDYKKDNINFKYDLDPWWDTKDQNNTKSYIAFTNHTFTDTFEYYNVSFNFTDRWIMDRDFTIVDADNGYGFNSKFLKDQGGLGAGGFILINDSKYYNFEVITKIELDATESIGGIWLGNDTDQTTWTGIDITLRDYAGGTTDFLVRNWTGGAGTVYYEIDDDALWSHSTIYWLKVNVTGSNITFFYSEDGHDFTEYYTFLNDDYDGYYVGLYGDDSNILFDNFIVRENIPNELDTLGYYEPSFIYDSSNESTWEFGQIYLFRDDFTYTTPSTKIYDRKDIYYPNDWDDWGFNITRGGTYYFFGRVCTEGSVFGDNCGTNYTTQYEIAVDNLTVNVYDEEIDTPITWANVSIDIVGRNNFNTAYNSTTDTGNSTFKLPIDLYDIRYSADNYNPGEYYINFTATTTESVNVYLLNNSANISDRIILTLYNEDGGYANNITVKLQRYYIDDNIYKTVRMGTTNFEGKVALYAELYDVWYKLIYEKKDGTVLKVTDPSPFFSTTPEDRINLEESVYTSWRKYDSVIGNVSFINDTGLIYARYIYIDSSNLVREGCLRVQRITPQGITDICNNCTSSTSATLTCIIDHTQEGQFKAVGTIDTNTGNSWYILDSGFFDYYDTVTFGEGGLFLGGILIASLLLMGIASATGAILFMILGVIGMVVAGFMSGFTLALVYWVVFMGLIILFMVRKNV